MRIYGIRTILLLMGMALAFHGRSEHLVGGEISYECLGNNEYLITLKIYRDCNSTGAAFDPNADMTIFQGNTMFQNTSWFGFDSFDIPIVATGPCFIDPPNLCLEMGVYERVISLPPSSTGYTIVHQRCCRGPAILNLNVPAAQGNTYFIEVPPNDTPCNSSAEFDDLPPATICVNEPLSFDHSATEIDGDELVYELCTPFNGGTVDNPAPIPASAPPYVPISWAAGFSAVDPIISDTPFTIDPNTGLLEGTPTQQGQYVVGICVSEYRNGELLSTTRRDFQINVVMCTPTLQAIPGIIPEDDGGCTGLSFQFTNNSFNADTFHWDFGVDGDPSAVSEEFEPQYTYPDTGSYSVMLVANPGEVCADTSFLEVAAYIPVSVQIDSAGFECNNGQFWSFAASGEFNPETANIQWDFGDDAEASSTSDLTPNGVFYNSAGNKTVSISVEVAGCSDQASTDITVPEQPQAGIAPQTVFCQGLSFNFANESENAGQYEWYFGDENAINAQSEAVNPIYEFLEPGSYEVMLVATAPGACADTAFQNFEAYSLLSPTFESPPATCYDGHSISFEAEGAFHESAEFSWDFGPNANPSTSNEANPSGIVFDTLGTHQVELIVSQDICEESHIGYVQLHPTPVADFSAAVREGCDPLQVAFTNESVSGTELEYKWDFGDGSTSQSAFPIHTYESPGTYTVQLEIATNNGCVGQSVKTRTDYITVYETPRAGFSFSPESLDILNPEVDIEDESNASEFCEYILEDGTVINDCDFSWDFDEPGEHEVIQVVTSEDGCQHSVTHHIEVLGHLFYAPNAFSPNEDGINDIFKPVVVGESAFEMQIINRSGEVIFTTDDPEEGWNGAGIDGDYYVKPEVFVYKVRLTDMQGLNYDYQGHVTVVR